MADKEKEDTQLPKQSIPAAEIPNLRKKEEERKKAGVAWGSGGQGAGAFQGAKGVASEAGMAGARAAAGATGAVGSAGAGAGFFSSLVSNLIARVGGLIAELTATLLGKAAVMAVAALMVGGIAAIAYKTMGKGAPAKAAPDLGALSSTIKVAHDTDETRLQYAAKSANGQLDWENKSAGTDDIKAATAKEEAAKESAAKQEAAKAQADNQPAEAAPVAPHLAGSMGGGFGSHDIFGGGVNSLGSGGGGKGIVPNYAAGSGVLGKPGKGPDKSGKGGTVLAKNNRLSSAMNLKHLQSGRSKSLALLRGMASKYNPSMKGGAKASEANSAAGLAQFESSELTNATPPSSPTDHATPNTGTGTGSGTGTGAGTGTGYTPTIEKCSADGYWDGTQCAYQSVRHHDGTPWKDDVDDAKSNMTLCMILLTIAGIIAVIGGYWKNTCCSWVGWLLFAIALGCAAGAIVCANKIVEDGQKINDKGGSPLGDTYKKIGNTFIICGIASIIMSFFTQFYFANTLIASIIIFLPALMALSTGLLTPEPPKVTIPDTPATLNCPEGQEPVDIKNADAGCKDMPNANPDDNGRR